MKGRSNIGGGGGTLSSIIEVTHDIGELVTINPNAARNEISNTKIQFKVNIGTYTITATKSDFISIKNVNILAQGQIVYVTTNCLVPIEYQAVEYLETMGNQYIASGVTPTKDFKVEVDIQQTTSGTEYIAIGYNVSGGGTAGYRWNVAFRSTGWKTWVYTGDAIAFPTLGATYDRVILQFEQTSSNTQKATIIQNGQSESVTFAQTTTEGLTLWLFAYRGSSWAYSRCKMFRAKMWNDGVLVGDYVPCYRISDSVAGMYDRISHTFFNNAGTGTFVVGGDI